MHVIRGTVITMNPGREIITNGAIGIDGTTITHVDTFSAVKSKLPNAPVSGTATDLLLPGYINGHQHLTGDRLIQSSIPDDLAPGEAIFTWVIPVHAEHTGDDDELSATLTLAESLSNGITTTFEAGTVAHPDRIAQAAERVGARLTIGTWGWDIEHGPFTGSVDEVIGRQTAALDLATGPLVSSWVSLVGHDLMSDELVIAATELARERNVGMTFHLSPSTSDAESYLARTGTRPVVHLDSLDVLGPHLTIAHAVHINTEEVDLLVDSRTSVVSCPWAYIRLGQGLSREFRHLDCGNETADLRSAAIRRTPATWSTECEPQHCSLVWRKNAILIPRYSAPTTPSSSSRSEERKHSESQITSDQSKLASRLTLLCTIDPVWNGSRQAPIPSCS
jgi:5-methylthioadenosine/S-adenosylhomocysteine deaminase